MVCGLRLAQSHARSTVSVAAHGPAATVVTSCGPSSVTHPAGGSATSVDALPHFDQRPKMSCVATEYRTVFVAAVPTMAYVASDSDRRDGLVVLTEAPMG